MPCDLIRAAVENVIGRPRDQAFSNRPQLGEDGRPELIESEFFRNAGERRTHCMDKQLTDNKGRSLRIRQRNWSIGLLRNIFGDRD
jgi:hypothetical protein